MRAYEPRAHPASETLAAFIETVGLRDACDPQVKPEEQVDRVLFRSSAELELGEPRCWNDLGFVDPSGEGLSDRRFWPAPPRAERQHLPGNPQR